MEACDAHVSGTRSDIGFVLRFCSLTCIFFSTKLTSFSWQNLLLLFKGHCVLMCPLELVQNELERRKYSRILKTGFNLHVITANALSECH